MRELRRMPQGEDLDERSLRALSRTESAAVRERLLQIATATDAEVAAVLANEKLKSKPVRFVVGLFEEQRTWLRGDLQERFEDADFRGVVINRAFNRYNSMQPSFRGGVKDLSIQTEMATYARDAHLDKITVVSTKVDINKRPISADLQAAHGAALELIDEEEISAELAVLLQILGHQHLGVAVDILQSLMGVEDEEFGKLIEMANSLLAKVTECRIFVRNQIAILADVVEGNLMINAGLRSARNFLAQDFSNLEVQPKVNGLPANEMNNESSGRLVIEEPDPSVDLRTIVELEAAADFAEDGVEIEVTAEEVATDANEADLLLDLEAASTDLEALEVGQIWRLKHGLPEFGLRKGVEVVVKEIDYEFGGVIIRPIGREDNIGDIEIMPFEIQAGSTSGIIRFFREDQQPRVRQLLHDHFVDGVCWDGDGGRWTLLDLEQALQRLLDSYPNASLKSKIRPKILSIQMLINLLRGSTRTPNDASARSRVKYYHTGIY